jgi:hypothetical protein
MPWAQFGCASNRCCATRCCCAFYPSLKSHKGHASIAFQYGIAQSTAYKSPFYPPNQFGSVCRHLGGRVRMFKYLTSHHHIWWIHLLVSWLE